MQKYSLFPDHTLIITNRPRASVWKWFILGQTLFYYLSQQPQYISRNKKIHMNCKEKDGLLIFLLVFCGILFAVLGILIFFLLKNKVSGTNKKLL